MTKVYLKFKTYSVLVAIWAMSSVVVLAQVDAKKRQSRLDIGKKKETITLNTKLSMISKPNFVVKEIRYSNTALLNQYFKTKLLAPTELKPTKANGKVETFVENASTDREGKLFVSDRITVSTAFPNPASEQTTIAYSINSRQTEGKLVISNVFGTPVAQFDLDPTDKALTIPTANLASGVYTYQLIVDGQIKNSKKLLVRHQ